MDFLKQKYKCGHGENLYNKSGQGGYVANFCFFPPQFATLGVCGVIPNYQYYNPFYDYQEAYYLSNQIF